MKSEHEYPEVVINVLGYRDDDEWVALALEMDLRGYGATFEAALEELDEAIEVQMHFAAEKGWYDSIWKPAEPMWYQLWSEARTRRMRDLWNRGPEASSSDEFQVRAIPPPHVIASIGKPTHTDA